MHLKKFNQLALKLRQNTLRAFIQKKEAHLGGSFSIIESLIFLYESVLKKDDKFILNNKDGYYL